MQTPLVAHLTLMGAMEMPKRHVQTAVSTLVCALVQLDIQELPHSPMHSLLKDAQVYSIALSPRVFDVYLHK